jgi:pimeloyl-ACP methyl ester carboxylesterase
VAGWSFTAAEAARIDKPMLLVRGGRSEQAPFAPRTVEALAAMVPHAEVVTVPGVTHLMPLQAPTVIAELIADFVGKVEAAPASAGSTD